MSWLRHGYGENSGAISLTSGSEWTDVCTVTVNVDPNKLLIRATWVATAATSAGTFRVTVDGSVTKTAPAPTGEHAGCIDDRATIGTPGSHTVKLQCQRGQVVLSTLDVAANAATLTVEEVSS